MYPKLIEIGPLTIHTYGLLLVTAYLVAIALAAHLAEKNGIPRALCLGSGLCGHHLGSDRRQASDGSE